VPDQNLASDFWQDMTAEPLKESWCPRLAAIADRQAV